MGHFVNEDLLGRQDIPGLRHIAIRVARRSDSRMKVIEVEVNHCLGPVRSAGGDPIGKTIARLLSREKNVLIVSGLDAIDGTPVIDIKPYLPGYDSATDARTPSWSQRHTGS